MKGEALANLRTPPCPDPFCQAETRQRCVSLSNTVYANWVHTVRAVAAIDYVTDFTLKLAVFGRGYCYDNPRDRTLAKTMRKEVEDRRQRNTEIAKTVQLPVGPDYQALVSFLVEKPCPRCMREALTLCKEQVWGPLCLARIYAGAWRPLGEWPDGRLYELVRDVSWTSPLVYREEAILWLMRTALRHKQDVLREKGLVP